MPVDSLLLTVQSSERDFGVYKSKPMSGSFTTTKTSRNTVIGSLCKQEDLRIYKCMLTYSCPYLTHKHTDGHRHKPARTRTFILARTHMYTNLCACTPPPHTHTHTHARARTFLSTFVCLVGWLSIYVCVCLFVYL